MNNQQILNIGVPVAVGFIIILAIGYGKSLHDDINRKPKHQLISRVDLRGAREDFEEITNDLNIMTSQIKKSVENLDKIESTLKDRKLSKSRVSTVARGKRNSKKKRK